MEETIKLDKSQTSSDKLTSTTYFTNKKFIVNFWCDKTFSLEDITHDLYTLS